MRKDYSLKSYDPQRLPGLVARVWESFPGWELEIYFGFDFSTVIKGDEALAKLSSLDDSKRREPTLRFVKDKKKITISLQQTGDLLSVWVDADPPGIAAKEKLHDFAVEALALAAPSIDEIDSTPNLYDINKRVVRILRKVEASEAAQARSSSIEGKSCFVSFNFDEHGLALAFELRDFLEILGVRFVSGQGYEPRPISQKVLERIKSGVSLFVVLFTRDDGLDWVQQEVGAAKALSIPVMVLVEEGVGLKPGLLADTEYVRFPKSTISKSFISVIQALRYVAEKK